MMSAMKPVVNFENPYDIDERTVKRRTITIEVEADYGLFTDPATRLGGEKFSYPVITYEAAKGIVKSAYWKPPLIWVIKRVRVMNRIQMSKNSKTLRMQKEDDKRSLAYYTRLVKPVYQIEAYFVFNPNQKIRDWNENKHIDMAKRYIKKNGRMPVSMGVSEFPANVRLVEFGEGDGYYDNSGEIPFNLMVHGINYPGETGIHKRETRFWFATMKDGVLEFPRPDECEYVRFVRNEEPVIYEDKAGEVK